jgi:hypothetical protein
MNQEFFAFLNGDLINLFFIPLGTTVIGVLCRYVENHDVFGSLHRDKTEQLEAHFENLRVGVDLILIGITAVIGIVELTTNGRLENLTNALIGSAVFLVITQLVLLVGIMFCHLIGRFPRWAVGLYLPNMLGVVAALLAIGFFRYSLK